MLSLSPTTPPISPLAQLMESPFSSTLRDAIDCIDVWARPPSPGTLIAPLRDPRNTLYDTLLALKLINTDHVMAIRPNVVAETAVLMRQQDIWLHHARSLALQFQAATVQGRQQTMAAIIAGSFVGPQRIPAASLEHAYLLINAVSWADPSLLPHLSGYALQHPLDPTAHCAPPAFVLFDRLAHMERPGPQVPRWSSMLSFATQLWHGRDRYAIIQPGGQPEVFSMEQCTTPEQVFQQLKSVAMSTLPDDEIERHLAGTYVFELMPGPAGPGWLATDDSAGPTWLAATRAARQPDVSEPPPPYIRDEPPVTPPPAYHLAEGSIDPIDADHADNDPVISARPDTVAAFRYAMDAVHTFKPFLLPPPGACDIVRSVAQDALRQARQHYADARLEMTRWAPEPPDGMATLAAAVARLLPTLLAGERVHIASEELCLIMAHAVRTLNAEVADRMHILRIAPAPDAHALRHTVGPLGNEIDPAHCVVLYTDAHSHTSAEYPQLPSSLFGLAVWLHAHQPHSALIDPAGPSPFMRLDRCPSLAQIQTRLGAAVQHLGRHELQHLVVTRLTEHDFIVPTPAWPMAASSTMLA